MTEDARALYKEIIEAQQQMIRNADEMIAVFESELLSDLEGSLGQWMN